MINGISAYSPYSARAAYGVAYANRAAQAQGLEKIQPAQRSGMVLAAQKVHQPDTPVQPVTPARPVDVNDDPAQTGLLRFGSDPAEMAVRMRIQYPGGSAASPVLGESKNAQEVMEEGECQTCKERKYQDGSDDPGVSFKTPTNVAPEQAASAVRGHENEHVVREQAKAQREDRKVVSQSVTYHTGICPECGKVYVSGGETRTVTKADASQQAQQQSQQNQQDPRKPFAAVA